MGEKERDHDLVSLRKEIATLVAEKCVDPATQRPYPVGMIEKAMAEAGFSVKQNKNAKSQVCTSSVTGGESYFVSKGLGMHQASPEWFQSSNTKSAHEDQTFIASRRCWKTPPQGSWSCRKGGTRCDRSDWLGDCECLHFSFVYMLTECRQTMLIDPGQFRLINELLQKECEGRGRLETLSFAATVGPSASS